jgi:hypothetical protein
VSEAEREAFYRASYTVGGMMVFPHDPDGELGPARALTLNKARGWRADIADRMDLTLDCIKRQWAGDHTNPLSDVLDRYWSFFEFFGSFDNYVNYFLLNDLLEDDHETVRWFFEGGFDRPALPQNPAEWRRFRDESLRFVQARANRIAQLAL